MAIMDWMDGLDGMDELCGLKLSIWGIVGRRGDIYTNGSRQAAQRKQTRL